MPISDDEYIVGIRDTYYNINEVFGLSLYYNDRAIGLYSKVANRLGLQQKLKGKPLSFVILNKEQLDSINDDSDERRMLGKMAGDIVLLPLMCARCKDIASASAKHNANYPSRLPRAEFKIYMDKKIDIYSNIFVKLNDDPIVKSKSDNLAEHYMVGDIVAMHAGGFGEIVRMTSKTIYVMRYALTFNPMLYEPDDLVQSTFVSNASYKHVTIPHKGNEKYFKLVGKERGYRGSKLPNVLINPTYNDLVR